jgi:hypothetical protein
MTFRERECYEAVIQSEAKRKEREQRCLLCSNLSGMKLQSTIRCTMPVASDHSPTDYPLCLCMAIYKRTLCCAVISPQVILQLTTCAAFTLSGDVLQATIQSTDYPLSFIRRCYNWTTCAKLYSAWRCYKQIIHLPSALIYNTAMLQTTCCALLCLAILQTPLSNPPTRS